MSNETIKPVLYFESVDLARTFREWKSPLLSVEFLIIQTFKELASAYKKLMDKEKEFEFYDAEMKSKWERLKLKQAEFMRNIEKYDAFFIKNEEKSNRILRKIESQLQKKAKFHDDISNCMKRIEFLLKSESKFENSLERLAPYRNFLEKNVKKIEKFENAMELINYYVLMNSETRLLEILHRNMMDTEKSRIFVVKCLKNKIIHFQEQNNTGFYSNEEYKDRTHSKKELIAEIQNQVLFNQNKMADVLTLKHSCNNTFLRLMKWRKMPCPRNIDDEKKSVFIIDTLYELQNAVELARQLNHKNDKSSQADSSFISSKRLI